MDTVILIIMVLTGCSLILKLTYLPIYGRVIICLVSGLYIVLTRDFASVQSKTQIAEWIQNPGLMLDIAVLLTIDVAMQITFCILQAKKISGDKLSRMELIVCQTTLWFPGILIFPTLLALLVEVIFSFPGIDFDTLAWTLGGTVFVIGVGLSFLIKDIIPEKDLRLELIFMVNSLIALLGVVATVNGRTAVTGTNEIEWDALWGAVSLSIAGAVAGFFLFKRNNNKKISHIK